MEGGCNVCRLETVCGNNFRSSVDSDGNGLVFPLENFERTVVRCSQGWLNCVPAKKHVRACRKVVANKHMAPGNLAGCSRANVLKEVAKIYEVRGNVRLLCRRTGEKVARQTQGGAVHELGRGAK